jgi:hypothetical protein
LWTVWSTGKGFSRSRGSAGPPDPFFWCGAIFFAVVVLGGTAFLGAGFGRREGGLAMVVERKEKGRTLKASPNPFSKSNNLLLFRKEHFKILSYSSL